MTQGIMKAQVIQYWYKILDHEFEKKLCKAILLELTQSTLLKFLTKQIELNMLKE
jgi:hypothetical protein